MSSDGRAPPPGAAGTARAPAKGPPAKAPSSSRPVRSRLMTLSAVTSSDVRFCAVLALELAGLEAALDEDAVALAELLGGALGAVAEDADAVPVGALVDPATLAVGLAVADRDAELGHGLAVRACSASPGHGPGCR